MMIEVPLFVESQRTSQDDGLLYRVAPLFFPYPTSESQDMWKATSRLGERLTEMLHRESRAGDHRDTMRFSFYPHLTLDNVELKLDLKDDLFHGWFPLVTFQHLDRTLAFSPKLRECWFELDNSERLADRADEVYRQYFRAQGKALREGDLREMLRPFAEKTNCWITSSQVRVHTKQQLDEPEADHFAFLGGNGPLDGGEELQKVGRCLDACYPDELQRALHRGLLVAEMRRLLVDGRRRPVLIVGPRLVGKTNLIHEVVFQRVAMRRDPQKYKNRVWLLSPQRLVSGMSYVGQWENRLLAILKNVTKHDHVLYFDDILGLYRAGVSASSTLCMADVLKPYIERREVQVIGEMTPEAWRVFKEQDRGFADMFHVLRIDEPSEAELTPILLGVARHLEERHNVRFAIDVHPTAVELTRRYRCDAAMPGKAAQLLGQLAVKVAGGEITREMTIAEFHAKSGLELSFLDRRTKLDRTAILDALHAQVIGQQAALEEMADVVCLAKARLNDPGRPLGSLLFLGPTGVGKTQCAKALARYLFGDSARLLRFDMNEFISPYAVARLVGTFDQPEGILTSAIRRQPFAVVLFDEIEKAHPDVFDMLLQVLGEGRLTDALGRTADFRNAVVILTSNLGTRRAANGLGFAPAASSDHVYVKAVEDFFRPEFVNRLDRVVPFGHLSRDEMARIAEMILHDIFAREGFARRQFALDIEPAALEGVISRGYHPLLGARAMRRAVEKELVHPVAAQLAGLTPETPTVLHIDCRQQDITVAATPLLEAERRPESARPDCQTKQDDLLRRCKAALDRLESQCRPWQPPAAFGPDGVHPQYNWYWGTSGFLHDIRERIAQVEKLQNDTGRRITTVSHQTKQPRLGGLGRHSPPWRRVLHELCCVFSIAEYLKELTAQAAVPRHSSAEAVAGRHLTDLLNRLALLEMLVPEATGWRPQRALVLIRSLGDCRILRAELGRHLEERFSFNAKADSAEHGMDFGIESLLGGQILTQRSGWSDANRCWWQLLPDNCQAAFRAKYHLDVLECSGHRAIDFLYRDQGTYLFATAENRLEPLQVVVRPLVEGESSGAGLLACLEEHQTFLQEAPAASTSDPSAADPFRWRPTIGIFKCLEATEKPSDESALVGKCVQTIDFPTGLVGDNLPANQTLMARLPLPREFQE